jgi:hypothetical protein
VSLIGLKPSRFQPRLQLGDEGAAIGEAGQRIGVGDLAHARFLGERFLFGALGALALGLDLGARPDQLNEALIVEVDQPQDHQGDEPEADTDAGMGGVARRDEARRERQGEQQQGQSRRRREAGQAVGAADRRQRSEQDDEMPLAGRQLAVEADRRPAEGDAQQPGEKQSAPELDENPLGRQHPPAQPHPIDQPHDDEQNEQGGRLDQGGGRLAAGEVETKEIDQGDRVEERDLALQRPVALTQQRPPESGLRLSRVEEAAHPEPDADSHRLGLAETG